LRFGLGAALLLLVVVAVYWPALDGQFVWDDALLVDKNPLVTGKLSLVSVWYRTDFPLTIFAFWLEWLVWGNHPVPYHVVNVLLHALGTILVWRVLAKLKIPGAWFAALIFGVHPVCVESVAWISEMKNTLSLPFFLGSIWCYLRFEEVRNGERSEERGQRAAPNEFGVRDEKAAPSSQHRISSIHPPQGTFEKGAGTASSPAQSPVRARPGDEAVPAPCGRFLERALHPPSSILDPESIRGYLLSLLLFVLALLSKTSTVMLPVVLLGFAWWRRGRVARRDVWRTSPFFVLALVF